LSDEIKLLFNFLLYFTYIRSTSFIHPLLSFIRFAQLYQVTVKQQLVVGKHKVNGP